MDGATLQERAEQRARELPDTVSGEFFGPGYEVFKVRGKVFMLMTEVPGRPVVIIKSDPEESKTLRQDHDDISPGYHMNKKHWITLAPGGSINASLVQELVAESYRLVVSNLPRAERPVDPDRFQTRE
ncbi:MmcQ/YjbR family DNA-binding protein [Nocardiopsis sp. NPDC055551]|uniref:MmcQ/YjbR family DNA-binding protein n=1 Tax=Nocardiopsis sp. NPDC006832 TaxID=3157188 RepID=UPI0033E78926